MKNKTVIISKHIHSGHATFQTGDEVLKMKTDSKNLGFIPVAKERFHSKNFPFLDGNKIQEVNSDNECIVIYLESDKTFYYRAQRNGKLFDSDSYSKTPEFKALVQSYLDNGFVNNSIPEHEAFKQREKIKEQNISKEQGIVLWMGYDEYKKNPNLYQGGFSNEVFRSKELQNYVKGGCVFGWIGNSDRKFAHDKAIEKGLRERGISPSRMFNWISSSSGRHFGDSLGGYTLEEQLQKIEEGLNYMYNCCVTYSVPSHGGLLKDSMRISDVLDDLKISLDTKTKYNKEKHLDNLFKAKETLEKKVDKTEDDTSLLNLVDEILINIM